jgi:energy-coupling factor transport system permease protein
MTVIFDTYVPGTSLLHRLDPRVKLWCALLSTVTVFLLTDLILQAVFIVGIHAVLLISGIPFRILGRLWRQMAVLVLLILVLQPFFQPAGRQLLTLGPLTLTVGGFLEALRLALRALSIAFVTAGVLYTTDHPTLVRGFVSLGLPYTWGLTISLALRFLPAIQNLYHAVRDAQAARGWVAEGNLLRRFRGYIPVLVAVLIGTLRTSDQLTLALAARGLGTATARTSWHPLRLDVRDWGFAISWTVAFTLFLWLY